MVIFCIFQNHLVNGDTCQVDDRTYQLEMSLFAGDDIDTMTNEDFVPQGNKCVTSLVTLLFPKVNKLKVTCHVKAVLQWLHDSNDCCPVQQCDEYITAFTCLLVT